MSRTAISVLILLVAAYVGEARGGQAVLRPTNLRLIGGYRVGWYNANINKNVSRSSGFPYGGMAAYTFPDGKFVIWHENGEQGRQVIESHTMQAMGNATTPPQDWPLLSEANSPDQVWTKEELFGGRGGDGFAIPQGLAFDPESQRLWVSARSTYATGDDPDQWLAAIDYPNRTVTMVTRKLSISTQAYGGGLGMIPTAFAEEHLGGRRLGFLSGGYESGQRASSGPTLAAAYAEPDRNLDALELMRYLTTSEIGSTPVDRGKHLVAQSFPDYTSDMPWHYPVTDGVGYWPGSSIRGNGAWIDVPGYKGILYMAARGAGDQKYSAQTEGGGAPLKNSLYIYNPDAFAEVAAGQLQPLGISRDYYDYYEWGPEQNGGFGQIARSLSYDPGSGLLWIYYPRVWRGDVEFHPVVAAYRIVPEPATSGMSCVAVLSAQWLGAATTRRGRPVRRELVSTDR